MVEAEKKLTPTQELEIRLVRISKLLYDLDLEFGKQGKDSMEYPWIDDEGKNRVEVVTGVYLTGLRKIRNNIYLALGKEGLSKEANMILQRYLTSYDIRMKKKIKKKSIADQDVT